MPRVPREIYFYKGTLAQLQGTVQPDQRALLFGEPDYNNNMIFVVTEGTDTKFNIIPVSEKYVNSVHEYCSNDMGKLTIHDLIEIESGIKDFEMASALPISEDGERSPSAGFTNTSIIGMLNELLLGQGGTSSLQDLDSVLNQGNSSLLGMTLNQMLSAGGLKDTTLVGTTTRNVGVDSSGRLVLMASGGSGQWIDNAGTIENLDSKPVKIAVTGQASAGIEIIGTLNGLYDGIYIDTGLVDAQGHTVLINQLANGGAGGRIIHDSTENYNCVDSGVGVVNPVYSTTEYVNFVQYALLGTYTGINTNAGSDATATIGGGLVGTALEVIGAIQTRDGIYFEDQGQVIWDDLGDYLKIGIVDPNGGAGIVFVSDGTPRLSIPISGAGNATQLYRSVLLGGYEVGAEDANSDVNIGNLPLFDASFIDCNTGASGSTAKPDMGIGGALQVIDGVLVGTNALSGRKVLINADDANETILLDTGTNTPHVSLSDKGVNVSTGLASTSTYVTPNNIRLIVSGGSQVLRNIYSALYGATSSKIVIESPASDVSIATIDMIGGTALITKEYADANYGGGASSIDDVLALGDTAEQKQLHLNRTTNILNVITIRNTFVAEVVMIGATSTGAGSVSVDSGDGNGDRVTIDHLAGVPRLFMLNGTNGRSITLSADGEMLVEQPSSNNLIADNAIINKKYADANYGGGGSSPTSWVLFPEPANISSLVGYTALRYRENSDETQIGGAWQYDAGYSLAVGVSVVMFTLPIGFRPLANVRFSVDVSYLGSYQSLVGVWCEIDANGVCTMYNGSPASISELYLISLNIQFSQL